MISMASYMRLSSSSTTFDLSTSIECRFLKPGDGAQLDSLSISISARELSSCSDDSSYISYIRASSISPFWLFIEDSVFSSLGISKSSLIELTVVMRNCFISSPKFGIPCPITLWDEKTQHSELLTFLLKVFEAEAPPPSSKLISTPSGSTIVQSVVPNCIVPRVVARL